MQGEGRVFKKDIYACSLETELEMEESARCLSLRLALGEKTKACIYTGAVGPKLEGLFSLSVKHR